VASVAAMPRPKVCHEQDAEGDLPEGDRHHEDDQGGPVSARARRQRPIDSV